MEEKYDVLVLDTFSNDFREYLDDSVYLHSDDVVDPIKILNTIRHSDLKLCIEDECEKNLVLIVSSSLLGGRSFGIMGDELYARLAGGICCIGRIIKIDSEYDLETLQSKTSEDMLAEILAEKELENNRS